MDFYNRRFMAVECDSESFAGIAESVGAEGIVVEEVGPALERADDSLAHLVFGSLPRPPPRPYEPCADSVGSSLLSTRTRM